MPPVSFSALETACRILQESDGNQSEAARRLGISRSTFRKHLKKAKEKGLSVVDSPPVGAHKRPDIATTPRDLHTEDQKTIRRLEAVIAATRRDLRIALERCDAAEDVRAGILGLGEALTMETAPPWKPQAPHVRDFTVLVPVLFGSDFQVGEVIKAPEVDGMNVYNRDVFSERYQSMLQKMFDISDNWVGLAEFQGMIYLRGGDAISGDIHLELMRTNDLSAVPAVRWLLSHEIDGIKRCADHFGRVRVVSIPGNHGRMDIKPSGKGYVERNFETILALWLEHTFESDPRIEFITPASGDAYIDIVGWKFVLSHGDRMGSRGGTGFIGPIATIARGHKRIYENWSRTGRQVDYVLTGHLHTSCRTEFGYGNGSLIGYNQYARDHRITPDAARQLRG